MGITAVISRMARRCSTALQTMNFTKDFIPDIMITTIFEIAHTIRREFDENGGIYKGMKLYSFVDNHDVDRIMSKLNQKDHIYPVYTLLYTLPGIPSLYYGSEWGIEGKKEGSNDDPLRPALTMEDLEKEKDSPIMEWVKKLGRDP